MICHHCELIKSFITQSKQVSASSLMERPAHAAVNASVFWIINSKLAAIIEGDLSNKGQLMFNTSWTFD